MISYNHSHYSLWRGHGVMAALKTWCNSKFFKPSGTKLRSPAKPTKRQGAGSCSRDASPQWKPLRDRGTPGEFLYPGSPKRDAEKCFQDICSMIFPIHCICPGFFPILLRDRALKYDTMAINSKYAEYNVGIGSTIPKLTILFWWASKHQFYVGG